MTAIVVANNEIPERAIITDALLMTIEVPTANIPPGAVLKKEDLIDKFTRDKLYAKTPIQLTQIAARRPGEAPAVQPAAPPAPVGPGGTAPAKPLDVTASYVLEKGRTMVAVDYPEAAKLITAGILRPKDRVDIYVKAPGIGGDQLALIFSNKEIHAIGDLTKTDTASPSPTLLFIDTPQNALVFKFIETMNPFLLIRSAEDGEDPRRTDLVTQNYVCQRFGLQCLAPGAR